MRLVDHCDINDGARDKKENQLRPAVMKRLVTLFFFFVLLVASQFVFENHKRLHMLSSSLEYWYSN
jgi:hypothetical protein